MKPVDAATDLSGLARELVPPNVYLALSTADADGVPWASPVWFAARGFDESVGASKPGARHSLNITANQRVSLVIFGSTKAEGGGSALYVSGTAALVDEARFEDALSVYSARSAARGLGLWDASRLQAGAQHRLYRAVALEAYVLGERNERVMVPKVPRGPSSRACDAQTVAPLMARDVDYHQPPWIVNSSCRPTKLRSG